MPRTRRLWAPGNSLRRHDPVTPGGSPLSVRFTLALNPFTEVSVKPTGAEVFPSATLTEGAEKLTVKVGVAAVTVSATVAVLVRPPSRSRDRHGGRSHSRRAGCREGQGARTRSRRSNALAGAKLAVTPVGNPVAESDSRIGNRPKLSPPC